MSPDINAPVPGTAILHSNAQAEEQIPGGSSDDEIPIPEEARETEHEGSDSDGSESRSPPRVFPHPLDERTFIQERINWREQYIRSFSAEVREKSDWMRKLDNPEIWKKWILEAKEQSWADLDEESRVACWSKECIDYAKKELEEYREYVQSLDKKEGEGAVVPSIDCVWKSDGLIEDDVRKQLLEQVALLENVPEEKKDWHPGSNRQVLDLVHPSLYPLVYNVTMDNAGVPIPPPRRAFKEADLRAATGPGRWYEEDSDVNLPGWSSRFQWLPSIFSVSEDGQDIKIKSYINNLDKRQHKEEFYPVLEKIFAKFVPLFENVLRDLAGKKYAMRRVAGGTWGSCSEASVPPKVYDRYEREIWKEGGDVLTLPGTRTEGEWKVKETLEEFEDEEPEVKDEDAKDEEVKDDDLMADKVKDDENKDAEAKDAKGEDGEGEDAEDEEEEQEQEEDDDDEYKRIHVWDLGQLTGKQWKPTTLSQELEKHVTLRGKDLKVIVKLANIVLKPEKGNRQFHGGSWHVEAMLNERIVSTGIYYYDQENITDTSLEFRQVSEAWEEEDYMRGEAAQYVYNMAWEGPSDQEIGAINTKKDRCIAFPNIFQHKVSSFKLTDKTKPGYRKMLVFFLCDPTSGDEIWDTSRIAPQNLSTAAVRNGLLRSAKILGSLPEDVFQIIMSQTPPAMTLEEAVKYREELMEERKSYNSKDRKVMGLSYNLCEH